LVQLHSHTYAVKRFGLLVPLGPLGSIAARSYTVSHFSS